MPKISRFKKLSFSSKPILKVVKKAGTEITKTVEYQAKIAATGIANALAEEVTKAAAQVIRDGKTEGKKISSKTGALEHSFYYVKDAGNLSRALGGDIYTDDTTMGISNFDKARAEARTRMLTGKTLGRHGYSLDKTRDFPSSKKTRRGTSRYIAKRLPLRTSRRSLKLRLTGTKGTEIY